MTSGSLQSDKRGNHYRLPQDLYDAAHWQHTPSAPLASLRAEQTPHAGQSGDALPRSRMAEPPRSASEIRGRGVDVRSRPPLAARRTAKLEMRITSRPDRVSIGCHPSRREVMVMSVANPSQPLVDVDKQT